MKRNEVARGIFIFIFGILFLSLVSASVILVTPASGGTVSGASAPLSATNGTLIEILNCTFYASSPSTANSSYVPIGSGTNSSASAMSINTTFASTILEDSNDYSIYASCWNATTQSNSTANTGITIDNTVPATPSSLSPSSGSTNTNGIINFSAIVNDARTTGCTLHFTNGPNPRSSSYTMTEGGGLCYYSLSSIPTQSYNYYITASDGTNTTNSATTPFNVHINSNSQADYLFQNQNNKQQTFTTATVGSGSIPTWAIILIAVVVIGIIIGTRKK